MTPPVPAARFRTALRAAATMLLAAGVVAAGLPSSASATPVGPSPASVDPGAAGTPVLPAAAGEAGQSCVVAVLSPADPAWDPSLARAVAWWNYALQGTGLQLSVTSDAAAAMVRTRIDTPEQVDAVMAGYFGTGVLGYAWPATRLEDGLTPGGVVLRSVQDPWTDRARLVAHELGHTLFAPHLYVGPDADPMSVMGAAWGNAAPAVAVNASDRAQVLASSADIVRVYCPGATIGPAVTVLPNRSAVRVRMAVIDWRPRAGRWRQNAGNVGTVIARSSREGQLRLRARVLAECARPDSLAWCMGKVPPVAAVKVRPIEGMDLNPAWVALGL